MNNTKEPRTQGVINSILGVMTKRQRIVKCPEHGYYLADEIWVGEEVKSQSRCPQCVEKYREEWKAKEGRIWPNLSGRVRDRKNASCLLNHDRADP